MDSLEKSAVSLKNLDFLVPHLPMLEGDLQALLFEIDQLIEQKKLNWERDIKPLRCKFAGNSGSNASQKTASPEACPHLCKSEASTQANSGKSNEDQLLQLRSLSDWMYGSAKPTRERQLAISNDATYQRLKQIERDNVVLLSELRSLNENHRTRTEVLASQLSDEKNTNARLQERCTELELRLKTCAADLEKERDAQHKLQSSMHSRQSELDILLQKANRTVELQANELTNVKQILADKQVKLAELSSQFSIKESDSVASKEAVHRLENVVLRHISLLTPPVEHYTTFSNETQADEKTAHSKNLCGSISRLERHLTMAQRPLIAKLQELSRLKSACNVASVTIRRLTETKTEATKRTAVLCKSLGDVLTTVLGLHESMQALQNSMNSKLLSTKNRIRRLAQVVNKARSSRLESQTTPCRSVAVQQDADLVGSAASSQTDGEYTAPADYWPGSKVQMLRNDWLLSVQKLQKQIDILTAEKSELISQLNHQRARVEDIQKDNLALTDLLTDAEKFNRTRIPCTTERSPRLCSSGPASLLLPPVPPSDSQSRSRESSSPRICLNVATGNSHVPLNGRSDDSSACSSTAVTSTPEPPASHHREVDILESDEHPGASGAANFSETPKVMDSTGRIQATPVSLSPAEYKQFVLSNGHAHCLNRSGRTSVAGIASNMRHSGLTASGLESTHSNGNSPQTPTHQCSNIHTACNGSAHVRPSSDQEAHKMGGNNSACVHWNDSVQPTSGRRVTAQSTSAVGNRVESRSLIFDSEECDANEDSDVYFLATKFLADEQQHSLQLERQIDMHIEELKRQMGL